MSLLKIENLSLSFGSRKVVSEVSFEIEYGERFALVGESGSGKTVSALSLLGLNQDARVQGNAWWHPDPDKKPAFNLLQATETELQRIRGDEISVVFQEPMTALNPVMTVGRQISEILQLKKGMGKRNAFDRACELLSEMGLDNPQSRANSYPHQLSGGQRQRAMIAMAIASEPRLLIADEPTTAIDATVRKQILRLLQDIQDRHSMAILLITHDLPLVRSFAQSVAVMEKGQVVESGSVSKVFSTPVHPYTKRLIASKPERPANLPEPSQQVLLEVNRLTVNYPLPSTGVKDWFRPKNLMAVSDVSLKLKKGETLALVGESGCGKSTLAQAVLHLLAEGNIQNSPDELPPVTLWGQGWTRQNSRQLRKRIQVVFQDPFSSLSARLTLGEIVEEGLLVHEPDLPEQERRKQVIDSLRVVGLTEEQFPGLLNRYPHQFSGGQRQRIAIARALILKPEILVLDEPTSSLDVTMARQVLELLQNLQLERGLSYLLITHDMGVVRAMAHRLLIMREGKIVEAGEVLSVLDAPQNEYTRDLLVAVE